MHDGDATWSDVPAELETASAAGEIEGTGSATKGVALRLAPLLTKILLGEGRDEGRDEGREAADALPIRVVAWDGSSIGPPGAPAFVIKHRRALRRLLWKPGEMGLVRAYVAGELDIDGDVVAALDAVGRVMRNGDEPIRLSSDDKRDIVRTAVTLGAVGPEPKPPPEELATGWLDTGRRDTGGRHTGGRDTGGRDSAAEPMREPAEFFARLFGDDLAHITGSWDVDAEVGGDVDQGVGLRAAQVAACAGVAERLGLFHGARLLDLSCGWGAFARYAAVHHGARVVALARTPGQADHARAMTADAEAEGCVEVRGFDLVEAGDGHYDAIVGLAGVASIERPASRLYELLAPGGRLVLQQPVRRPGSHQARRSFITSYMFPDDADLRSLGALLDDLEGAGLEVRRVEALREDHARTLRAWAAGLRRHWTECEQMAGPGRARVWLLYLAASALACESGQIGRHEIRAIRRDHNVRAAATKAEGRTVMTR
ncbi:methyltransferase domain-containing protein [Actinomadura soli]|uniref:Methyltransferase domain-containing protein n=1 Tax=Actinomadura soli TaxID=2508997 RepID=A0A5C4J0E6_9ACTN|nr:class I SAM-dependent methyltransferase [Actinomadura soli]TMQ90087.1 methyltransferase domain-containing protein [Actinomadura soli]